MNKRSDLYHLINEIEETKERYSEMITNYSVAKKRISYLVHHSSEIKLYDILKKENLLKKGE